MPKTIKHVDDKKNGGPNYDEYLNPSCHIGYEMTHYK